MGLLVDRKNNSPIPTVASQLTAWGATKTKKGLRHLPSVVLEAGYTSCREQEREGVSSWMRAGLPAIETPLKESEEYDLEELPS
jgi:hypothetical protein